jgi:hypothetical protein
MELVLCTPLIVPVNRLVRNVSVEIIDLRRSRLVSTTSFSCAQTSDRIPAIVTEIF